ncbi:MAG TPA: TlpA disulfide reductase family protein [Terriglobales bacterium]|nr:TlpA disulfide reductase family protein [Terriglobales bacterium]
MTFENAALIRKMKRSWIAALLLSGVMLIQFAKAQNREVVWSADEKPIAEQIHNLRSLPDDVRAGTTKDLALKIRQLPATENKLRLAFGLANLSTEGDFGHAVLQEVTTTLVETLKERPLPWAPAKNEGAGKATVDSATREPAAPYVELASLVRYEHVEASLDNDQYHAAMSRLEADDRKREHADLSLKDLNGKTWTLSALRGKVVLVNFWATWCPPCRKEMPDLQALYERFEPQGLVILGISDEETSKVEPFIHERKVTFPILLDPGREVNEEFIVKGIPKSFVYDREGKLVAQSIDMRTQKQFLEMLSSAGLQ